MTGGISSKSANQQQISSKSSANQQNRGTHSGKIWSPRAKRGGAHEEKRKVEGDIKGKFGAGGAHDFFDDLEKFENLSNKN